MSVDSKPGNFLSLVYRELEKLAGTKESRKIPVLVQRRAQKGELPLFQAPKKRKLNPSLNRKENRKAASWAEDSQEVFE